MVFRSQIPILQILVICLLLQLLTTVSHAVMVQVEDRELSTVLGNKPPGTLDAYCIIKTANAYSCSVNCEETQGGYYRVCAGRTYYYYCGVKKNTDDCPVLSCVCNYCYYYTHGDCQTGFVSQGNGDTANGCDGWSCT